jgi:hypothetical protein
VRRTPFWTNSTPVARRASEPVAHVHLVPADAFLLRPVEVAPRKPERLARLNHRVRDFVAGGRIGDVQRAARGVILAGAALLVLGAAEIGEDIVPGPALAAQLPPTIIIRPLSAYVEQGVYRGGAAEHAPARPDMLAPAGARVRLRHVEPVDLRVLQRLRIADGKMDPEVGEELRRLFKRPVVAAGFQQQHARAGILAETRGEHAAGRTRADDDIISLERARPQRSSPQRLGG